MRRIKNNRLHTKLIQKWKEKQVESEIISSFRNEGLKNGGVYGLSRKAATFAEEDGVFQMKKQFS